MLRLKDFHQLNALLGTLLTFKFGMPASDPDVQEAAGSPFLAEALNAIYDATISSARERGDELTARLLVEGRSAEARPNELKAVRELVRYTRKSWLSWDPQQKREYLESLLSPYQLDDTLCHSLIEECDQLTK